MCLRRRGVSLTETDFTPATPNNSPKRSKRNLAIGLVFAAIAVAIGAQAISSARVFFLNVDEAVAQRQDFQGEVIRMQGIVLTEPDEDGTDFRFALGFNGEQTLVDHVGIEPTELFSCGQNVVVEGVWNGNEFQSSQVLVKHSEEYLVENAERVIAERRICIEQDQLDDQILEFLEL